MADIKKYLDYQGLEYLISKLNIGNLIQKKTFNEWLQLENNIPEAGTVLVYSDRSTVNGVPVPDIKIADGKTTVGELSFLMDRNADTFIAKYIQITDDIINELSIIAASPESNELKRNNNIKIKGGTISAELFNGLAETAKKVQHTLTIGDIVFDGSEDKSVPIYNGQY